MPWSIDRVRRASKNSRIRSRRLFDGHEA
jgi:hypothetical protein